ncbi:hypothetical protein HK102_001589 [Quaeritorhiza haematococci]|nr:hypothetical protein HK102_001589 [Quaeritorhiza haematococci]
MLTSRTVALLLSALAVGKTICAEPEENVQHFPLFRRTDTTAYPLSAITNPRIEGMFRRAVQLASTGAESIKDLASPAVERRDDGDEDALLGGGDVIDGVKEAVEGGLQRRMHKRQNVLAYYTDMLYWMSISIAGRPFKVLIDTGSADLWVPDEGCGTCGARARYIPSLSTTKEVTNLDGFIQYGLGSVSGKIFRDNVNMAGRTAVRQTFLSVTSEGNSHPAAIDGLIGFGGERTVQGDRMRGLSWLNYYTNNNAPVLMESLWSQNRITNASFAIWLDPFDGINTATGQANNRGGQFTLGGFDPNRVDGPIVWMPVVQPMYWWVQTDLIRFGGNSVAQKEITRAILDSGTALIVTDETTAADLNTRLGATRYGTSNIFTISCTQLAVSTVQFEITLGGNRGTFTLRGSDFLVPAGGDICYSPFMGMNMSSLPSNVSLWILGEIFLRKYYSIYSYNYASRTAAANPIVGLARARNAV